MVRTPALTCITWTPNYLTMPITSTTDLLHYKWSLSYCLKSLASTSATGWRLAARSTSATFTCSTLINSFKWDYFWSSLNGLHKFNFQIHHNVSAFSLNLLASLTTTSKHLFEFLKNITWGSTLSKLILKTFKTCKTLSIRILTRKRILCLFISSHTSLIVNSSFVFIA